MSQKVVVINAGKMNYDNQLDFSVLSPTEVAVFADSTPDEFIERIADATVVVTKEYPVSSELLAKFPSSVKLIVEAGTGFNNIDLAAARKLGITVCNIPAYSSERVAHTAIMLMLNLASSMQVQMAMLAKNDHQNFTQHLLVPHVELNGKTLGVLGAGNIGQQVMKIALAMDMKVLCATRTARPDSNGIHYVSQDEMLRESDFISLHCPLNEATHHIIDATALAMMKPTAFIINTARGALIDETALITALQEHKIAGAGLDVQEHEPPAEDNPLYKMPNVILTPHMGWKGLETRQRLVSIIADNIKHFFAGQPINVVS